MKTEADQLVLPAEPVEGQYLVPSSSDVLAISRAPELVLEEAQKAAQAIKKVIEAKPKKVQFQGKTYLQFEDWQTLGRFYGVTAIVRNTKFTEFGDGDMKVSGFEATAEALLVSTNQVVSSAEALCLDDEKNWKGKPLFQLKSMAQTRACAKALRNVLAWVVVLAGYAPTPAEEMDGQTRPETQARGIVMDADYLQERIADMKKAANLTDLWERYKTPYKEAMEAGDEAAQRLLMRAKDAIKKELAGAA
jgi:hypothetical protein